MLSSLAILIYLLAFAIPLFLLYRYHSVGWYWHVLALLAAVGMGFVQPPAGFDLVYGALFVSLVVWGLGGLVTFRWHREKHA